MSVNRQQAEGEEEMRAFTVAEQPGVLKSDDLAILSVYVELLSSVIDLVALYMEKSEDIETDKQQSAQQGTNSDTGATMDRTPRQGRQ